MSSVATEAACNLCGQLGPNLRDVTSVKHGTEKLCEPCAHKALMSGNVLVYSPIITGPAPATVPCEALREGAVALREKAREQMVAVQAVWNLLDSYERAQRTVRASDLEGFADVLMNAADAAQAVAEAREGLAYSQLLNVVRELLLGQPFTDPSMAEKVRSRVEGIIGGRL